MTYDSHILITFCVYTALGQSLVLAAGFGGMMSLSQAASLGVASYSAGLVAVSFGSSFFSQVLIAAAASLFFGWLLSLSGARHFDDEFILASLAIQVLFQSVVTNWQSLTGGPLGLSGIPGIRFFGWTVTQGPDYAAAFIIWLILSSIALHWISKSRYTAFLSAASSDPIFATSLGIAVTRIKGSALMLTSLLMVVPGILYASYARFLEPSTFSVGESILVLTVLIIGGRRSLIGVTVASAGLVLSAEGLKGVGLPAHLAANGRQVIFGALLILAVVVPRPSVWKRTRPRRVDVA